MTEKTVNILLGCTGSVATIKIPNIVQGLKERFGNSAVIRLITTQNAKFFLPNDLSQIEVDKIYTDDDEWSEWSNNKKVLHIDLAQNWCDIFIIAPLDANTLAKLATGLTDNLLTSVARAWDFGNSKKILFAPAMNTAMWEHPVTQPQVNTLKSWGYIEIPPIAKMLACKTFGMGAMAEPASIVDAVKDVLQNEKE